MKKVWKLEVLKEKMNTIEGEQGRYSVFTHYFRLPFIQFHLGVWP